MRVIACAIKPGTYVGLQSAFAHHGLFPEYVPETICVGPGRLLLINTHIGRIRYQHITREALWGYEEVRAGSQSSFVARPEKALLDLIYLTAGGADLNYIAELRLQNLEGLDMDLLSRMIERYGTSRLQRVRDYLAKLMLDTESGIML